MGSVSGYIKEIIVVLACVSACACVCVCGGGAFVGIGAKMCVWSLGWGFDRLWGMVVGCGCGVVGCEGWKGGWGGCEL